MAVTVTLLVANSTPGDASSYNPASITPTASRWLVADVGTDATAVPNVPVLTDDGPGYTYTQEATVVGVTGGGTTRRLSRFYTWTGSSPSAMVINISLSGQTQEMGSWIVYEIDGVDTVDPFVQTVTHDGTGGASATPVITLAAFASSNNRPLALFGGAGSYLSAEGSYVLVGSTTTTPGSQTIWLDAEELTPSVTYSGSAEYKAIASEIKAAGGAAAGAVLDPMGMRGFFGA